MLFHFHSHLVSLFLLLLFYFLFFFSFHLVIGLISRPNLQAQIPPTQPTFTSPTPGTHAWPTSKEPSSLSAQHYDLARPNASNHMPCVWAHTKGFSNRFSCKFLFFFHAGLRHESSVMNAGLPKASAIVSPSPIQPMNPAFLFFFFHAGLRHAIVSFFPSSPGFAT